MSPLKNPLILLLQTEQNHVISSKKNQAIVNCQILINVENEINDKSWIQINYEINGNNSMVVRQSNKTTACSAEVQRNGFPSFRVGIDKAIE